MSSVVLPTSVSSVRNLDRFIFLCFARLPLALRYPRGRPADSVYPSTSAVPFEPFVVNLGLVFDDCLSQ